MPPYADLSGGRGVAAGDDGGGPSAPEGEWSQGAGADSQPSSSEGGCSVVSRASRAPNGFALGVLGALALLGLRRRPARR
jgi:hypothetical protein